MADADIGLEGEAGEDFFHFRIVTPKRIIKWLEEDKIVNCRCMFIVSASTIDDMLTSVEKEITEILDKCEKDTWEEVANSINAFLHWEYSEN